MSGDAISKRAAAEEATVSALSYRAALYATMRGALAEHDNTLILGQGADDHRGIFGTTLGLAEAFGAERVMDLPLSEEAMTGVALGAALNGLYPIQTHIRADFMMLAMNQLINLVAKYRYMFGGRYRVPMLIRGVIGRSWGQGAQHSQSPQSMFAHVPGLTVIMPSSASAVLQTYPWLIENYPAPVISLEHRLLYDLEFRIDGEVPDDPLKARLVREGGDVTIVATSIMVLEAMRAAKYLAEAAGIECEIIDLHCISHPDADRIIESVKKTGRLIVADTSWVAFGVAAEICRIVAERVPDALKAPVRTIGMQPAPCPTAKSLEDLFYPTMGDLVDAAARLATGKEDHGVALPDERSMTEVYRRFKGPF